MPELITAIRRLDARSVLSYTDAVCKSTTEYSSVRGVYPLSCERDFLRPGYGLMKVSSVTEAVSEYSGYNPFLYERYFLVRKNFILPLAKRIFKQGSFVELFCYINSYNLFQSERGRPRLRSLCWRHAPTDAPRNLHLVPCFLSDRAVDVDLSVDHDPTDIDELDRLSLDGWIPARDLSMFVTNRYLGMFNAVCPWSGEIYDNVSRCQKPLPARMSPVESVDMGQLICDSIQSLPLYEFRATLVPVKTEGSFDLEVKLLEVEFACPVTARLWHWHDKERPTSLSFPDYLTRSVREQLVLLGNEIGIFIAQAGFNLSKVRDLTIYRGSDDVVCIVVNRNEPLDNKPPMTVAVVDVAKAMITSPSFARR